MGRPALLATLTVVAVVAAGAGYWAGSRRSEPAVAAPPPVETSPSPDAELAFAVERPEPVRSWIGIDTLIVGGGSEPSFNQVSIEQDLALARRALPDPSILLFAGGPGSPVQVVDARPRPGDLRSRIGDLFDPRDARATRYRSTELDAHGPATRAIFESALVDGLGMAAPRLIVYLAGHGEAGEQASANRVLLWGDDALQVAELARFLDGRVSGRGVVFVITACFSGGFADMVFAGADESAGPALSDRCGLFASTWDREASGCDPDPDRRAQESYALHFLHALRGEDRNGRRLPVEELDLDGDRQVSLLEAHTRARIASRSIDVPTSTSERFLRHAAPAEGPAETVALVEEQAVIAALSHRLGLAGAADAEARLAEIDARIEAQGQAFTPLDEEADRRYADLTIAILARWPVLDDPFHPDFEPTLAAHGAAIERLLDGAPEAAGYREAEAAVDRAVASADELDVERAEVERLRRAFETVTLAGRLRARGGPDWERYGALLQCERAR